MKYGTESEIKKSISTTQTIPIKVFKIKNVSLLKYHCIQYFTFKDSGTKKFTKIASIGTTKM